MSGHTPGELWTIDPNHSETVQIEYESGVTACAYCGTSENARVVLASTDLLEALKTFMREWDAYGETESGYSNDASAVMNDVWKNSFINMTRAAIAKAEPHKADDHG